MFMTFDKFIYINLVHSVTENVMFWRVSIFSEIPQTSISVMSEWGEASDHWVCTSHQRRWHFSFNHPLPSSTNLSLSLSATHPYVSSSPCINVTLPRINILYMNGCFIWFHTCTCCIRKMGVMLFKSDKKVFFCIAILSIAMKSPSLTN